MHARKTLTLAIAALTCSLQAGAIELNEQLSLIVTPAVFSDYRSSGISQTLGDPAAQLDIMLSHASGLYAGVWTSNVEYGYDWENDDDYGTRQEIDYYAGYYWQISDAISLDGYYNKYTYPGESQFNGADLYLTLDAYGFFIGGKHSFDTEESYFNTYVGYRTLLPLEIGLELRYENVDQKDDVFFNADYSKAEQDYNNWEIKLTRDLFGATWGLSYVDTDLSDAQCASFSGYDDLCSAGAVASVSKAF
ncbi:TorF family putative porin [Pseudomonas sp. J452]|uniref:TorF family putative porin n=1 Tax=Pseudomonas sp. J452 TaxID=2898441 RepID=UPI0021AE178A|nr:TorF family putative porin [Pseudomonas sp. J452]UUY07857.1 TorF family putative porin [Pseudomonas sp. J452]